MQVAISHHTPIENHKVEDITLDNLVSVLPQYIQQQIPPIICPRTQVHLPQTVTLHPTITPSSHHPVTTLPSPTLLPMARGQFGDHIPRGAGLRGSVWQTSSLCPLQMTPVHSTWSHHHRPLKEATTEYLHFSLTTSWTISSNSYN